MWEFEEIMRDKVLVDQQASHVTLDAETGVRALQEHRQKG